MIYVKCPGIFLKCLFTFLLYLIQDPSKAASKPTDAYYKQATYISSTVNAELMKRLIKKKKKKSKLKKYTELLQGN